MNEWIAAGIAIAAGMVLASIARSTVTRSLGKERRPEPLRASATALGGLAFSIILIGGLLVALGIVDPDSLEELPRDLIDFVPKGLSAAILVIGGNVLAAFADVALRRALTGVPASTQRRASSIAKAAILGAAILLAAGQLGVDTTIINLAAAALFFSVGAAFALLSGLGGRQVSGEIAAGRAIRRMLDEGDRISIGECTGVVARLHPAAIELTEDDGTVSLVPNSAVFERSTRIIRRGESGSAET